MIMISTDRRPARKKQSAQCWQSVGNDGSHVGEAFEIHQLRLNYNTIERFVDSISQPWQSVGNTKNTVLKRWYI